jgi:hypothetical protein
MNVNWLPGGSSVKDTEGQVEYAMFWPSSH